MDMRTIVQQLIEEEIRLTGFIRSLNRLGLEANDYLPNLSQAVFELLHLEKTDDLTDKYFQLIESGEHADQNERKELAESVLMEIENHGKP